MNNKIVLGNTMHELALLKLENDKLRSAEDRRNGETDFARAKEKEPEKHIVVFDTANKILSSFADSAKTVKEVGTETEAEAKKIEELSELMQKGAKGVDLAAEIAEDLRAGDEEVRAILDGIPHPEDRSELLGLIQRLANVLTGQKPENG